MSNFATIPVAESGRVCSDSNGLSPSQVQQLLSGQVINAGWLFLGRFVGYTPEINVGGFVTPAAVNTTNTATAQFVRYSPFDYSNYGGQGQTSIGGCVVSSYRSDNVFVPPTLRLLDPGAVTLRVPDGSVKTLVNNVGSWSFNASSAIPGDVLYIPDAGGSFQFDGSGGSDVGAFHVPITIAPQLVWTNRASITNVDRGASLEVTWSGGEPNSYLWITGVSTDGGNPSVVTSFTCTAPVATGRFTIPQAVLGSLVASFVNPAFEFPSGQLAVANYGYPASFTASGLDIGLVSYFDSTTSLVNYR